MSFNKKQAIELVLNFKKSICFDDKMELAKLKEKYESGEYIFVLLENTKMYGTFCIVFGQNVEFEIIEQDIEEYEWGVLGVTDKHYTYSLVPAKEITRERLKEALPTLF